MNDKYGDLLLELLEAALVWRAKPTNTKAWLGLREVIDKMAAEDPGFRVYINRIRAGAE